MGNGEWGMRMGRQFPYPHSPLPTPFLLFLPFCLFCFHYAPPSKCNHEIQRRGRPLCLPRRNEAHSLGAGADTKVCPYDVVAPFIQRPSDCRMLSRCPSANFPGRIRLTIALTL